MCEGRYEQAVRFFEAARADLDRQGLDSGLARFEKIGLPPSSKGVATRSAQQVILWEEVPFGG